MTQSFWEENSDFFIDLYIKQQMLIDGIKC